MRSPTTPTMTMVDAILADDPGAGQYPGGIALSGRIVDLGTVRIDLRSNATDFEAYHYFTRFAPDGTTADYRVDCVDLDVAARDGIAVDEAELAAAVDGSFRALRFRSGFYLTYYFGPPAYLFTRGDHHLVFGRKLERTVWPYFVKHLLTVHAADTDTLHLKAAGFADPAGNGTLLFGRSGAGKTVFLTSVCAAGMRFLTNTHVLLRGIRAHGVPAAIRVRDDPATAPLLRRGGGDAGAHLLPGEFRVDPTELFPHSTDEADVRTLCIVDHRPDRPRGIREIPAERCYDFLEQFAFPVSAYGLKDDLLAYCGGDLDRYTDVYARMKAHLRALVDSCRLLQVNMDLLDPTARREVLAATNPAVVEERM